MTGRRAPAAFTWVAIAAALVGSAAAPPRSAVPATPEPPLPEVETALFLVGDAGHQPGQKPVLDALSRELAAAPARSLAVFLGDNIYPRGLREPGDPSRADDERRLDGQIEAVRASGARGLFVPGNHDWDRYSAGGWAAIRRQAEYVTARGGPAFSFLPKDGCPGPEVVDVGRWLRLVAVDTQWWLHKGPKPRHPDSTCAADSEEELVAALRELTAEAGERRVVVVCHHPLATGGTHGAHFTWKDHVFPLRAWKGWLWVPLPVIGSLYPKVRSSGRFPQDVSAPVYKRLIAAMERALAGRALVWASGHEHSLQILDGRAARYLLVSGAGSYGNNRAPRSLRATRYASGEAGFMRLDVGVDGRVRVGVLAVDKDGGAAEVFSLRLQ